MNFEKHWKELLVVWFQSFFSQKNTASFQERSSIVMLFLLLGCGQPHFSVFIFHNNCLQLSVPLYGRLL